MKFVEVINPRNQLRFYVNAEQIHSIVPGDPKGTKESEKRARIYMIGEANRYEHYLAAESACEIFERLED